MRKICFINIKATIFYTIQCNVRLHAINFIVAPNHNKMNIIFIASILVNFLPQIFGQKVVCTKNTLNRVDEYVFKLLTIGNSGRKFPENKEQLVSYCK